MLYPCPLCREHSNEKCYCVEIATSSMSGAAHCTICAHVHIRCDSYMRRSCACVRISVVSVAKCIGGGGD